MQVCVCGVQCECDVIGCLVCECVCVCGVHSAGVMLLSVWCVSVCVHLLGRKMCHLSETRVVLTCHISLW